MTSAPRLHFLPIARHEIGAEAIDALKSGWVPTGPKAQRFETDSVACVGDDWQRVCDALKAALP